jgi:hypothetical protein
MRYLFLLLPLVAIGCANSYGPGHASGDYRRHSAYAAGYGSNDGYGDNEGYYGWPYYPFPVP